MRSNYSSRDRYSDRPRDRRDRSRDRHKSRFDRHDRRDRSDRYDRNDRYGRSDRSGGGRRDQRSGGNRFGGGRDGGRNNAKPSRPKVHYVEVVPREGRDPELNLFIDPKFTYWNLPSKARVLLVSNIPKDLAHPDLLYSFFSLYGDVEKIKVIRRESDCALIEFSTATCAAVTRDFLDNFEIMGEKLVVSFSRFDRVRMPEESGLPNDGYIKDFTTEEYKQQQRFSTEEMQKMYRKHTAKPSQVLYVGDLKDPVSPQELSLSFVNVGLEVVESFGVEDLGCPGRMFVYLSLKSVDDAVTAVCRLGGKPEYKFLFVDGELETIKKDMETAGVKLLHGDDLPSPPPVDKPSSPPAPVVQEDNGVEESEPASEEMVVANAEGSEPTSEVPLGILKNESEHDHQS